MVVMDRKSFLGSLAALASGLIALPKIVESSQQQLPEPLYTEEVPKVDSWACTGGFWHEPEEGDFVNTSGFDYSSKPRKNLVRHETRKQRR